MSHGVQSGWRVESPLTVAVLVHVPHLAGYFARRLEVIQLCFRSLQAHTEQPFKLLVLDNGSCREVRDYLEGEVERGFIDILIRSTENLGVIEGVRTLFRAAPAGLVAYSDDDIYFYPGWLEPHLQILTAYPNVGMVSGVAVRDRFSYGSHSALRFGKDHSEADLQTGRFLPDSLVEEYVISTGKDPEAYRQKVEEVEEVKLTYSGVEAYATANHFQFLAPRDRLLEALPPPGSVDLMAGWIETDKRIDELGYLRLSTLERYVRHIGNFISPETARLAAQLDLEVEPLPRRRPPGTVVRWVLQTAWIRGKLVTLYKILYGWLTGVPSLWVPWWHRGDG